VLELLDPPAGDGQKRRTFSLVSAPFESTRAIATRMRDTAFKRALKALPDGASVKLSGPIGQFTLADAARPAVFIAGGIGITPFMSRLRQANQERSTQSFLLLYSNRRNCRIPLRAAGARAEQRQLPAVRHDDGHGELRAQMGRRKRLAQRGRDTALCRRARRTGVLRRRAAGYGRRNAGEAVWYGHRRERHSKRKEHPC
jgi:ferredoxin-NADP reductase